MEVLLFRRHQQLKHEETAVVASEVIGEASQARGLTAVQRLIAFRVIADQHFAEGGLEGFDMLAEFVAVFKIEFVLAALFGGAGGEITGRGGIAEDRRSELLIDENAGFAAIDSGSNGVLEGIVDDAFGGGDAIGLLSRDSALPTEHSPLKRAAMIEGKDIERPVIPARIHDASLPRR